MRLIHIVTVNWIVGFIFHRVLSVQIFIILLEMDSEAIIME